MRWSGSARGALAIAVLATLALAAPHLRAQAGPPFQTDDPTPVDLGHYEAYLFGTVDGTPVEIDSSGPAFEFNWGALPNIQLHAILPLGAVVPLNHPSAAPAGQGPATFGLTDTELGVKFGFIKQTAHSPQIGTFPMFEIPTGNADRGLGVGKVWYRLPIWVERSSDRGAFAAGWGIPLCRKPTIVTFSAGDFSPNVSSGKSLSFPLKCSRTERRGLLHLRLDRPQ